MLPSEREWFQRFVEIRLERERLKQAVTREMLLRSYEALERSRKLLQQPVPTAWPSEQPKE
ncbi:hypothetical protein A5906_15010 [Bradyrhizobium sacchari]|nr:hypothetical protein A5906_15010 [Bradyrhizobium sacchari]